MTDSIRCIAIALAIAGFTSACEKSSEDFRPQGSQPEAAIAPPAISYPGMTRGDDGFILLESVPADKERSGRVFQPDGWPPAGPDSPREGFIPHPEMPTRLIPVRVFRSLPGVGQLLPAYVQSNDTACPYGKCGRQLRDVIIEYQARADRDCSNYQACVACCDQGGQPVYFLLSFQPNCQLARNVPLTLQVVH